MDFASAWLNQLLVALEERLDGETREEILAQCSQMCTEPWSARAREIREGAADKDDVGALLAAFRDVLPGGGPDVLFSGSTIRWSFSGGECPCPVGQAARNAAMCLCGIGHVRGMMEPLLGRPLRVTLQGSRLRGDAACCFAIHLLETTDA